MFKQSLLAPFGNRLQKVDRHRSKLARRQELTCYRVYDFDLPEFPMVIDRYGDCLYLAVYQNKGPKWLSEQPDHFDQWLSWCLPTVESSLAVEADNIFIKQRRRKSHLQDQYQKTGTENQFFQVQEGGLKFLVNLTDYLDTGLFLDHRDTRAMVRDLSNQKRVLNLFCYTGSFSVYAADGNAAEVTSVDLSNTYLSWTRDNLALNRLLDKNRQQYIKADVFAYLDSLSEDSYDVVVMDPPTFSNSKAMEEHLDIQRDHVRLINQAMRILSPGGILIFSTNYRKFTLESDRIHCQKIQEITRQTTPFDFQGKMRRWCYRLIKDQ